MRRGGLLLPQPIKYIRRDGDPNQDHHPYPPGEHVVVVQEPAPRLTYHVMEKQELKGRAE